ncbi:hypothetical protein [Cellulomonas denverensis]|uniref:Uncharacterized protein n=1 Tax=Cellulomonas denverensis TaxID=264297 RepID=A0A7X6QZ90_9CELL|nr:hypothetical protein [Cellulomonas denverensis]NKY22841.1 hypothetical protein [Cellulomonas denverensis]GIG25218.1 hypothetical protein Cde04nite_14620 [Cellulomonas denverensis]
MSAPTVPARRRVLVRGELVHDLTAFTVTDPGFRLVLPTPLPTLVLRADAAERVDLLSGERQELRSALCGPSTRPWAVREPAGSRVTVLRLRPEALVRLGVGEPRALVDGTTAWEAVRAGVDAGSEGAAVPETAAVPGDAGLDDGRALDRELAARAMPRDPVLRQRLGEAVGLILAERGLVTAVDVARAAQVPPSELFRLLDEAVGTGPEQLAAAQRLRCTVRDAVPAGAPLGRVLTVLGDLRALPPRELLRLGLDHLGLEQLVRRGAALPLG